MELFHLYNLVAAAEREAMGRSLRVVCVHLCRLLVALAREDGPCRERPGLGQDVEGLASAAEDLAAAARRWAEESGEEERVERTCPEGGEEERVEQTRLVAIKEQYMEQMRPVAIKEQRVEQTGPAAASLQQAGRCLHAAARELLARPGAPEPRWALAMAARTVLAAIAKILQIEGAAKTRRIIQAADRLLGCLSTLRDAEDAPGTLSALQVFSEALLPLNDLAARCLQEPGAPPRHRALAQAVQLLQRCLPLLHAAKPSDLEQPRDQEISPSKDYAFQLTERTIRELISLLRGHADNDELHDRAGLFSKHVRRLLALLSCPASVLCSSSEVSAHADMVVFYCVLLADLSGPDTKLELVEHCRFLLQLSENICSRVGQEEGQNPGQNQGGSGLEEECHTMKKEVESLNRTVVTATLCQILNTFFEAKEPLRQLVEGALGLAGKGCFSAGAGGFLKMLQPLTSTFFTHVQQMLRVADIVVARCTNPQTAGEIRDHVEYLKRLLAGLPPLLAEMSGNVAQVSTAEQLQSLYQAWAATTESLLLCFEETVPMHEFVQVSIQQMAKHREWCEKALESQDLQQFSWHVTILTNWAQWVVEATTRYVDRTTDPVFRNGLLVWIEQLGSSIAELKTVVALCPERLSYLQTRLVFARTVKCLLDTSHRVQDGLDGSNHPDILSPLREQVRSAEGAEELELSPSHTALESSADATALQEDVLSGPSSRAASLHPDVVPRKADPHPVIAALLAATRAHDMAAVNAACSALLELSTCCIRASKEALPLVESPLMETLGQFKTIEVLTARVIRLARETASRQSGGPCRLLQMSLKLSERICKTKECLAAAAGSWHSLSQQVFHFISSADFLSGKQALDEPMAALAGIVHFAGDIASLASRNGNDGAPSIWESFRQVQAQLSHAQINTQVLLEKAASLEGSCRAGEASVELHCVLWAIGMRVLLSAVDRFAGRDLLLLRELSSAARHKLCLWSILPAVFENSLRLQEAARLSYLSCPEDCGCSEILVLREEIRVLMEALLEASRTLSVSWLSTASLFIRFELLQRELALRAKALLLHLEKVNVEYLEVMRDVFGPALSPVSQDDRERSKQTFEEKAARLMANVQRVRSSLQDVLEATAQLQSQASLLSAADRLQVVTCEAVNRARRVLQSPQDTERVRLELSVWDWSARAHYLVTQLQAAPGVDAHVSELVGWCLRSVGDQRPPRQCNSISELLLAPEFGAPSHAELSDTCLGRSEQPSGAARDTCKGQQNGPPSVFPVSRAKERTGEDGDVWQGDASWIAQVTKDMAARMLHMTQFLKKKGPITTKEQFVACARRIASAGQALARFGSIVATHCLDRRCSAELLGAVEQTRTVSGQLGIVARVKAVTAESKSSSELLVRNAQNLMQAVSHVLAAAEAACVKGLRPPPPGSEEAEVAAFCTEWRKILSWHRAKECLNSDRDELGLRRTRARPEPTLMAMVQECSAGTRTSPGIRKPLDDVRQRRD